MNESIHGEKAASEPQDRSLSVAHSIEVPSEIIRKWQEIVDLLAEIMHVPSASIMRVDPPHIKVFVSSTSKGNPCEPGALDTGPYCETVMKTGQPLLVPDALENEAWKANPHVKLGMISYLGVPIGWPDGRLFGTICVRDNKRNEYSEAYLKLLLHFRDMLQADLKSFARLHGEIEEREAKIRHLVDANIIGIIIWNLEGRILEANDAFLRMTGYDREDLASGRVNRMDLTPAEWHDRDARTVAELKMIGTVQPFEKEYFRKDGSRLPVLSGGALFEASGNQGVSFVLDLTERKRAEAEARESERRYRETLMELTHANRVATMGQLTASITHEVKQPITAAVTYALAARRWLSAEPPNFREVDEALSLIVKEGNRAGEVVGRIRALIKKAPARKDAVEINDAILEIIALTRTEAASNGVSVRTQLAEGLPRVQGDRVQLQQVMLNLIVNAIQSMSGVEDGNRELHISTESIEPEGVCVAVRDTGHGLRPESLSRLFEPFYTTKPDGMGMGLSICRSIIEAHGGRLWAIPCEPQGALFQFTIPAD